MGYIGNQPAETPVVEILETDFKIGEDDQTKIDFADANTINFHANNAKEMVLVENSLSPGTSDGTALGTTSLMWSDIFLAQSLWPFPVPKSKLYFAAIQFCFMGKGHQISNYQSL